jgi:CTP synthase (UTP-ammonia lyase)
MKNNIIIGIVAREEEISNTKFMAVTRNNMRYLYGKCSYIGLINYNGEFDPNVLELCDGIIIQGGSKIYPYHFKILEYAINHNIPVLGICMGHQIIGLYSVGSRDEDDLVRVDNHYSLIDSHNINIVNGTLLDKLFGSRLEVNSRHLFKLEEVEKPFKVSAYSDDGVIEGIEYIDCNHFIIGVQWHPEDLDNMEGLYNYFIKEILKRKTNKMVG